VNSISRHVDPELTDEFVAGLGIEGISTVAEFQEYAKQGLEDQALEDFNYNVKMQVLTLVMNNAQIQEPPAELVEKYKNVTNSQMEYQASMYGVDLETFVNAYFGMDLAAYETEVAAGALETAKQALVCYKIALEENLIATEEELNSYIEENYASMGYASAEAFKETVDLQEYADSLLIDNVLTFLAENAAVTEAGSALQ
jgi:trigger factor